MCQGASTVRTLPIIVSRHTGVEPGRGRACGLERVCVINGAGGGASYVDVLTDMYMPRDRIWHPGSAALAIE